MMTTFKQFTLITSLVVFGLFAMLAVGQPLGDHARPHKKIMRMHHMINRLDLNEEQRDQLEAIKLAHQDFRAQIHEMQRSIMATVFSDSFSIVDVNSQAEEIAASTVAFTIEHAQLANALYQSLSIEQRAMVEKMDNQRKRHAFPH